MKYPTRLEKAKIEHRLALVAYMLHPTREGKMKMDKAAEEFADALIEHQCSCTQCLTRSMKATHNLLVCGNDALN